MQIAADSRSGSSRCARETGTVGCFAIKRMQRAGEEQVGWFGNLRSGDREQFCCLEVRRRLGITPVPESFPVIYEPVDKNACVTDFIHRRLHSVDDLFKRGRCSAAVRNWRNSFGNPARGIRPACSRKVRAEFFQAGFKSNDGSRKFSPLIKRRDNRKERRRVDPKQR